MKIIGAGMAGLLAANMLRRHKPVVYELKKELPFNHSAVLRFRNEGISRATGIPFKKILVHKAVMTPEGQLIGEANLRLSNMYSQKVTGAVLNRSVLNLASVERFIAPADFVQQMAISVNVVFGSSGCLKFDLHMREEHKTPVISTIPMPTLMDIVGWDDKPEFKHNKIWTLVAELYAPEIDVYQTIYYPDPDISLYRASLTGSSLIMEFIREPHLEGLHDQAAAVREVLNNFGIRDAGIQAIDYKIQPFGKIIPISDLMRKHFIYEMSDKHHIYSLGRFSTWRQLLLDDLVKDVQFIESFINQRDLYSARKSTI